MKMVSIAVTNRSSAASTAEVSAAVAAIQIQISRDFLPRWGSLIGIDQVSLEVADAAPAGAWSVAIEDHADIGGDLGYHLDDGIPAARVFAADALRYGVSLSATLSHELLEMLADPLTTRTLARGAARFALEVCDPVEDDALGYRIAGVLVSDFILPGYFGLGADGSAFDCTGALAAACPALAPGGYQLTFANGAWSQVTARHSDGRMPFRAARDGRKAFRAQAAADRVPAWD